MRKSEKKKLINDCVTSLLSVAPNYYGYSTPTNNIDSCERVFAYEFYHQLRCTFKGRSWYVHGEFKKGLAPLTIDFGKDIVYPDIVLHLPESLTSNLCAFEIKSSASGNVTTGADVLSDLKKLEMFTRPSKSQGLNFELGVLILINKCFDEIYKASNKSTRKEIEEYLTGFHRIAIWNIEKPNSNEGGEEISVDRSSLKTYWKGISSYNV